MTAPRADKDRDPVLVSDDADTVAFDPRMEAAIEAEGARIGPYKLLQEIGKGGFGVVYMAEQVEPVRRKVALKIIKPGMDTKEVIARFESERQALALMDHPNIARVLDAGATDSGRPFFVMELVKGVPITEYCDKNNLTTEERLALVVAVCHAVQHAHQKGIIHRDLKPSNILVTLHDGKPVPKVIDFGVAKATNQQLTERTLFTQYGQMIGTPAYVSPEQAEMSGLDIDTRSDIYSLGVVLYELLTGSTPFDSRRLRQAGVAEMQRIIREEEPPRPSTRLSTLGDSASVISAQRATDLKRLGTLLKGELDWIVMKSLEKERGRRYATPNDFAADIERFLRRDPIEARPPSRLYRLRKFVQRNTAAVSMAVLILMALVIATAISTVQAIRANRETTRAIQAETAANKLFQEAERLRKLAEDIADKARLSAAEAQAVSDFLHFDVLAQANPQWQSDRDLSMRDVLDRAAGRLGGKFDKQPLVEASLQFTIGHAFEVLGAFDRAEPHLRRAVELRRRELGESHRESIVATSRLAYLLRDMYRLDDSEQLALRLIALNTAMHGSDHPETLSSKNILVWNLHLQGRAIEAEKLAREILEIHQNRSDEQRAMAVDTRNMLSKIVQPLGKLEESEALARQVLQIRKDRLRVDHPYYLQALYDLSGVLQLRGKLDEAISIAREAHATSRRVMGEKNPRTLLVARLVAQVLYDLGESSEAAALLEATLPPFHETFGAEQPETVSATLILAIVSLDRKSFLEAEQLAKTSVERIRNALGPEHPETLRYMGVLGEVYLAQGQHDLAAPILEPVIETARRVLPAQHRYLPIALGQLGALRLAQGRLSEAIPLLRESFASRNQIHPAALETQRMAVLLGSALIEQARAIHVSDPAVAEVSFHEAESLLLTVRIALPTRRKVEAVARLVELYSAWNKPNDVAKWRAELEPLNP